MGPVSIKFGIGPFGLIIDVGTIRRTNPGAGHTNVNYLKAGAEYKFDAYRFVMEVIKKTSMKYFCANKSIKIKFHLTKSR